MNNSRNRVLIFLVIFLLLTNIAMLLYITAFEKRPARPNRNENRRGPVTGFLQNELGFSKTQMDMVDSLKRRHRVATKPLFDELGKSKDNFYRLIGQPGLNDSLLNASAAEIGRKQAALDLQFFKNFISFRKLCTEGQLPKFDSVMPNLVSKMMQPWQKNNNPRKKDSTSSKN
jgi:protein CpxP